jgi:putative glutamine amidotransferase
MKRIISVQFLIASLILILGSCSGVKEENGLTIAISKDYSKEDAPSNYYKWLLAADSSVNVINLYDYTLEEAMIQLEKCDGLLLSGGADIYPGRYGKEADTARCGEFDLKRDTIEFAAVEKALELDMPIFGICRGMQMLNVALGGTLYIDIPTDYDTIVEHRISTGQTHHLVNVNQTSRLYELAKVSKGEVTSYHHQGIEKLAEPLRIVARADDNFPEAVEWTNPSGKSFMMAVQFHPERYNYDSPLSLVLAENFLLEVLKNKEKVENLK